MVSAAIALGAAVAATAQPASDATRVGRTADEQLYFVPAAAGVKVAASGFEELVADLMWTRAVLTFGERYDTDHTEIWREWISSMILVVSELDPRWRTPYQYGGGMLRAIQQVDEADLVFERCSERLPELSWCPFARGMNDLLERDDPAGAGRWLEIAATRPDAPRWYSAAAAAMKSRAGQRRAGLKYIEDQLETVTNPAVRASLETQYARLSHDELVSRWEAACRARLEAGNPLTDPKQLAELGIELPADPRGDGWIVGADGVVRDATAEQERKRRARQAEWKLIHR